MKTKFAALLTFAQPVIRSPSSLPMRNRRISSKHDRHSNILKTATSTKLTYHDESEVRFLATH
ncbi:hypothetical protein EB093_06640 [bacterium]|nr:hypothetical protein [bacterium]